MAKNTNTKAPSDPQEPAEVTPEMEKTLMRRISAARTKLLAMVPFFGHLALNLKPRLARPADRVSTAGVAPDGTLILSYEFCMELTDPQLCGLLCHEVLHPALFCWMRQGSRHAIVQGPDTEVTLPDGTKRIFPGQRFSLWNLAHDLSFNPEILELAEKVDAKGDIELPPGGAVDLALRGMSAEEIYDKLLNQALKNRKKGGKCGDCGGTGKKGGKKGQKGQGQEDCPSCNGTGKQPGSGYGVLTEIPGGDHAIGDDLRPDLSSTEEGQKAAQGDKSAQTQLENDWKVSVVAAAQVHEEEKNRGSLPAGLQKIVDELVDPRVDWKDVLSRWIGENGRRQDYTYRRPARRSESVGAYMPSLQRFGVADIVVLWDTSGSMNGREKEILGDVQGICEDLGLSLRVMCCDTMVHTDVDGIEDALDVIPHIKGGGGSDFTPAFAKLEDESYDGVVVSFTDGYIGVPATKPQLIKAVLWVLAGGDVDPTGGKWGETLLINDQD
jgi:predicted metal-dependent peptidase